MRLPLSNSEFALDSEDVDLLLLTSDGAVPTDDDAAMKWVREMRVHMQRNLLDAKPINVRPILKMVEPIHHPLMLSVFLAR